MLWYALIRIVAKIAQTIIRSIIRTFYEIMKVRLISQLFGSHGHYFAVVTPYPHFFCHKIGDFSSAASVLTRNGNHRICFHMRALLSDYKQ